MIRKFYVADVLGRGGPGQHSPIIGRTTPQNSSDMKEKEIEDAISEAAKPVKGGTRKIADLPTACGHKEHNPPMFQYFENGIYEHICPQCGQRQIFMVNHPTL